MFKFIQDWLANQREARIRASMEAGWDFAAGKILEDGDLAIKVLESAVRYSKDMGDYGPFDAGIEAAILKIRNNNG